MRTLLAPPLDWFDQWMTRTAEPVPDFDALPARPELPDLLRCEDGTAVADSATWARRRCELRTLVQHWLTGTWPEPAPVLADARTVQEAEQGDATWRHVELTFAGPSVFSFDIELLIPHGTGPFPVFMTQSNHRRWAVLALSRGYLCCLYPGADLNDQSAQLAAVYPEHDWSKLTRRAWLGCRALDYVLTLSVADSASVAITGHSRNGKQSLIAAAMDERIGAVISSSSGSGGAVSWRCSSEFCFQESVEFMSRNQTTREWFHPRIRLFTGREDRLPVDNHALLGLIAPRACLISDAMTDGCGSMFGVEMSYLAAREVYRLLDTPERLGLMWRWGNHETDAQVIHRYVDWCDTMFGRGEHEFPEELFFGVETGQASVGTDGATPPANSAPAKRRLEWLLGEAPPRAADAGGNYGKMPEHRAAMVGLSRQIEGVEHLPLCFSEYVRGELFFPSEPQAPLRPVIWLHPFSHSYGTAGAYMVGPQIFHDLARHGYAVLAYTQLGCGQRTAGGRDFYGRFPRWSKMGKMVRDVQAAVDLLCRGDLACAHTVGTEALELPDMDTDRITVLGYSLGGLTAFLAAALDERIAAVASFCGAVPFRQHALDLERGAMHRFWQLPDLLPRLQGFAGREAQGPVGLEDVLGLIAPRPCLVLAPQFDREIDCEAVQQAVGNAPANPALTLLTPADYNRFQTEQHEIVREWLGKN